MTNEEKANELYQSIPQYPYHIQYDETIENFTAGQLCDLLEEMAEWKDRQFKEYLEKKRTSLSLRSDLIGLAAPFHAKPISEIISELFWGKKEMKLTLSLKKKWYDMIASGEKKEEYRNITQYWMHRLMFCYCRGFIPCKFESCSHPMPNLCSGVVKRFDAVTFTLGYPKKDDMSRRMTFKIENISIGTGKPEWGAEPDKNYFIIKLGERIKEDRI